MTEEDARAWLADRFPAERIAMLENYVGLLRAENSRQNLISKSSEARIWARHIVDSAQLLGFAREAKSWLDVGSGAGLPGIVLACLTEASVDLIEPRARRVTFLRDCIARLGLANATVYPVMVGRLESASYEAVTARAYTSLEQIFETMSRLTGPTTIWVLPKGRSAESELAVARATWQGVFHVEQSATDDQARIVIACKVRRTKQ